MAVMPSAICSDVFEPEFGEAPGRVQVPDHDQHDRERAQSVEGGDLAVGKRRVHAVRFQTACQP